MGAPIDRTAKTALDLNLVNGVTSDAPKIKASDNVLYDYVDGLNAAQDAHSQASTLAHPDGSVKTAKIADGAVTEPKYAAGSVTLSKLSADSISSANHTYSGSVPSVSTTKTAIDATYIALQTAIGSSSISEVADARTSAQSNTTYSTLKARLDDENIFANQANFTETIKNLTGYSRTRFAKLPNNQYEVVVDNGGKHVTYNFEKDTNDDFIKLGLCVVGQIGESYRTKADISSRTGTWVNTGVNNYSIVIGSTFTASVVGSIIKFYHFSDNRGGLWEFVVDGDTANKVQISTYNAVSGNYYSTIKTGLSATATHTVVGTFLGADPANAPSTSTYALLEEQNGTLTGTWVTSSPPLYYTTTIGDSFTASVKGSRIVFNYFADNRGGLWEFTVDGDTANKVQISTWSATNVNPATTEIKNNLNPSVTHTVSAVFKGDDPAHVPSGGAGTGRGWIYYNASASPKTIQGQLKESRGWAYYDPTDTILGTLGSYYSDGNPTTAEILSAGSNKEMAFSLSVGGGTNYFVPDHGTGTAFIVEAAKFILDDVEISLGSYANYEFISCYDFKLVQHIYAQLPGVVGNVAEIWITHHIGRDGVVTWNGSMKALQTLTVAALYPLMFPIRETILNEVISSIGTGRVNDNSNSNFNFTAEKDLSISVCGVSSSNPNYVGFGTVKYPLKTMRHAKSNKPNSSMFFLQRTIAPKVYFNAGENWVMSANEIYNWSAQVGVAWINNIYKFVKS